MTEFRPGQQIGPWRLVEVLEHGGNATVWRAAKHSGQPVALKILRTIHPRSEPYKRFQREIGEGFALEQ